MTLNKMTLSKMTLSKVTLSKMTLSKMTHYIMTTRHKCCNIKKTFSRPMTACIKIARRVMYFFETNSNATEHNDTENNKQ
jgi:hypothetical protein